eukprot:gene31462-6647_t
MQAGARDDQDGATNAGTQSDAQDPPTHAEPADPPQPQDALPTGTPPPPTIPSETSEAMAPSPQAFSQIVQQTLGTGADVVGPTQGRSWLVRKAAQGSADESPSRMWMALKAANNPKTSKMRSVPSPMTSESNKGRQDNRQCKSSTAESSGGMENDPIASSGGLDTQQRTALAGPMGPSEVSGGSLGPQGAVDNQGTDLSGRMDDQHRGPSGGMDNSSMVPAGTPRTSARSSLAGGTGPHYPPLEKGDLVVSGGAHSPPRAGTQGGSPEGGPGASGGDHAVQEKGAWPSLGYVQNTVGRSPSPDHVNERLVREGKSSMKIRTHSGGFMRSISQKPSRANTGLSKELSRGSRGPERGATYGETNAALVGGLNIKSALSQKERAGGEKGVALSNEAKARAGGVSFKNFSDTMLAAVDHVETGQQYGGPGWQKERQGVPRGGSRSSLLQPSNADPGRSGSQTQGVSWEGSQAPLHVPSYTDPGRFGSLSQVSWEGPQSLAYVSSDTVPGRFGSHSQVAWEGSQPPAFVLSHTDPGRFGSLSQVAWEGTQTSHGGEGLPSKGVSRDSSKSLWCELVESQHKLGYDSAIYSLWCELVESQHKFDYDSAI